MLECLIACYRDVRDTRGELMDLDTSLYCLYFLRCFYNPRKRMFPLESLERDETFPLAATQEVIVVKLKSGMKETLM